MNLKNGWLGNDPFLGERPIFRGELLGLGCSREGKPKFASIDPVCIKKSNLIQFDFWLFLIRNSMQHQSALSFAATQNECFQSCDMSARSTSSCCHCCIFSQAAIVTLKPRRRNFVLNMTGVIILLMDRWDIYYMGVSKNSGTPKSSILIRFSIIFTSILGYPYFWKHPYQPVQDFFHQEYYEPKQCTFFSGNPSKLP